MKNDVFEPKMAYLLDNNKTDGTTYLSPAFLLRLYAKLRHRITKEKEDAT